jgi:hypothetical protein
VGQSISSCLRLQPRHQPIQHIIIEFQLVGDLIGFDENRLGLFGALVGQVLEVSLQASNS